MDINTSKQMIIEKSHFSSNIDSYARIVCCLCNCSIESNQTGMCQTCFQNQADISQNITKSGILIQYCRQCDRYMKNNWVRCGLESLEMMSLCLSKVRGLTKNIKIIDSSFVWTEAHSKRIKIKLTIQKEVLNNVSVQKNFCN